MKRARFLADGRLHEGEWREAEGVLLDEAGRAHRPNDVVWLPPVEPRQVIGLALNYADHAEELGLETPPEPVLFLKPITSLVGHRAPVVYPKGVAHMHYEVELAVVIGHRGRDIPVERALDYVFGYTILNDVTARDLQRRHEQWFKGKTLDTFAPMGPAVVHRSLVPDPQALRLRTRVNGQVRQDSTTAHMVFSVAQLISVLSAGLTLEPGDILATGTPEGVAMGMTPPAWLRPGDVVEVEIEGIGVLRNPIVAPPARGRRTASWRDTFFT
ncbi:MAG: fumarylacetoacetate hydrolase family protein [Candidatus Rokubacteria bacterium]|nr:fumarylacetoacetate hydrolase family protein [Candidatus Rokubacteria bacterium]